MRVVEPVMGTAVSIDVPDDTDPSQLEKVTEWLRWVHETFTVHRHDSPINRFGRGDLDPADMPVEMRHVLTQCERLAEMTEGAFNHRTNRPDRPLDPSAYVKGWSLDEAAAMLRIGGVERFALGAGGDIVCLAGAGEPWPVGLQHPTDANAVAAVFELTDHVIATSGRYARGDHIWSDDKASSAADQLLSVSVIGVELAVADALATALLAADDIWPLWMSRFPDHDVVVLTASGERQMTAGAHALLAQCR